MAPTLRVLLAAAAICGWKVEQMDVKTAFLYGMVDEKIYMKQLEGYDDGSGRVCRLNKAVYGLKKAPRCWYARLVEGLEALGFKVSGCDESLFSTEGEEEKVFLLVYVDDILLFSPSLERIKEVQGKLKETFQCKALGPVGYYHRLHVESDEVKGWLRLHQRQYLDAMGEKYGLEEGRSVMTPLPSGFQLHLDEEDGEVLEYELQRRFQSMVGSLMYASVNTRPDIAFSVSQLACVVSRPLQEHLDAAERLLRFCLGGFMGIRDPNKQVGVRAGNVAATSRRKAPLSTSGGVPATGNGCKCPTCLCHPLTCPLNPSGAGGWRWCWCLVLADGAGVGAWCWCDGAGAGSVPGAGADGWRLCWYLVLAAGASAGAWCWRDSPGGVSAGGVACVVAGSCWRVRRLACLRDRGSVGELAGNLVGGSIGGSVGGSNSGFAGGLVGALVGRSGGGSVSGFDAGVAGARANALAISLVGRWQFRCGLLAVPLAFVIVSASAIVMSAVTQQDGCKRTRRGAYH
ncbi:unnamed protein product [Closterium sp. NIES-53]